MSHTGMGTRSGPGTGTAAILAIIVIVLALWLAGGRWLPSLGSATPPSQSLAPASTAESEIPFRPADAFPLTVSYVFDGDTIEASVQKPNDLVTTANPIRIRLIGIDTPEGTPTPECWADEARAHLRSLLPEGSVVWAGPGLDTWDEHGRRLFYLWTSDGRFVNHELVAAGDAEAIRVWPNVEHFELLARTQAAAEASGAGRWGACG